MSLRVLSLVGLAVACSDSPLMPEDGGPPARALAPAQFAWLSVTGRSVPSRSVPSRSVPSRSVPSRSVGGGFEWTAVPLICADSAGVIHTGADCLEVIPVGAAVTTFQGRSARISGLGVHPCSYEGRTTPGWELWMDPAASQQPARPFSHVGELGGDWRPRAARPSTEAERSRLPVLPPAPPPGASPAGSPVVRTALTADLLPEAGLEAVIERHRAGAGTELWVVGSAQLRAIPFGAAPADSVREVAGVLDRGPDGVLVMLWSQSPAGGAGKHVARVHPDSDSVELLAEWWCGSPPPSSALKR